MTRTVWTDEQLETLREGWQAGASIAGIALRVGRTRNAVIGKAGRLELGAYVKGTCVVPFEELDLVPLPPKPRKVLAALLAAHPHGVSCEKLARLVLPDADYVATPPEARALRLVKRLSRRLNRFGWTCRRHERKGVKLFPVGHNGKANVNAQGTA